MYGHGVRSFKSFKETAQQASISRLHGGIYYKSALDNGGMMGEEVGLWVLQKAKTRKNAVAEK